MKKYILSAILFLGFIFTYSQVDKLSESILFKPSSTLIKEKNVIKMDENLNFDSTLFNDKLHKELNSSVLSLYTFGELFNYSYSITTKGLYKPISKYAMEGLNEAAFYKELLPKELKLLYH